MEQLIQQLLQQQFGNASVPMDKVPHPDTSETVNISALALLKMLRHARSGVPLEVMGLMLGTFIDEYTINVIDVFAMPQSGTSVTVESVDPVYQMKHMEALKATGRPEMVVGWYHSHPGFGCWLSSTDQQTQKSFENLHPRAIAVVVDPVQSVKGKVVLSAFRLADGPARAMSSTAQSREITSNMGDLERPDVVAVLRGLGRSYYSMVIKYNLTKNEQKMLRSLHRKTWLDGMNIAKFSDVDQASFDKLTDMNKMAELYAKDILAEKPVRVTQAATKKFGHLNAKHRLEELATKMMQDTIVQELSTVINANSSH